MEKVSKIVPSNSRIESVDLSKNKSGRLKLPGMGRDTVLPSERLPGSNLSAIDRLKLTDEFKALKPDEARRVQIAEKAQNDFFVTYNQRGALPPKLNLEMVSNDETPTVSAEAQNLNLSNANKNEEFEEVPESGVVPSSTSYDESSIDSGTENNLSLYA